MSESSQATNRPWRRRAALTAWAVLVFGVAWYMGRRAGGGPGADMRVYDVRDLLVDSPDFDNAPRLGIQLRPTSRPAAPRVVDRTADLVRLIRGHVDPGSWDHPPHGIAPLAGQFVVTQTPEAHAKLRELLRSLREARAVQISVETRFVSVDEAFVNTLPGPLRERLVPGPSADGAAGAATAIPLSKAEVRELLNLVQKAGAATLLAAPRVTTFSGQRAYAMVGGQVAYVGGVKVARGVNGQDSYGPDARTVDYGVVLDVHAAASADRKRVTLRLRPQWAQLMAIETVDVTPAAGGPKMTVQRPIVDLKTLDTTVTLPDQATMLIAGFTSSAPFDPMSPPPGTAPATRPAPTRTFILVKPTVVAPPQPLDPDDRIFPAAR